MPPRYQPRHPEIFTLGPRFLALSFLAATRGGTPETLPAILRQEAPGVVSFDLFTPAFCEALLEEIHRIEHFAPTAASPCAGRTA